MRRLRAWSRRVIPHELIDPAAREWMLRARHKQYPLWRMAEGAPDTWLVIGGRGAGKTIVGAEWVNGLARGFTPFAGRRYGAIGLVGDTLADAREVMIDGPSGIRTLARGQKPRYEAGRRLVWDESGAVAQVFSAEDPESLRGPQFEAAWLDELAKWKNMRAAFDMLQFGLRLGERPQQLITTTPKPAPLIRALMADPGVFVTRMATSENAANLAQSFLRAVEERYAGTRLGRQELEGELVGDREGALWTRTGLEAAATGAVGELRRIVVAVDPPASSGKNSDACGIVAAGLDGEGRGVVIEDATIRQATPARWAAKAIALWRRLDADCIVAEVNQGGEMVAAVLRSVDPTVPVKMVRANRGKWLRAEPVAALYEQGRVRHAKRMPELEDEMCDFGPDGLSDGRSPDRLDALVWALAELMLARRGTPRVRDL